MILEHSGKFVVENNTPTNSIASTKPHFPTSQAALCPDSMNTLTPPHSELASALPKLFTHSTYQTRQMASKHPTGSPVLDHEYLDRPGQTARLDPLGSKESEEMDHEIEFVQLEVGKKTREEDQQRFHDGVDSSRHSDEEASISIERHEEWAKKLPIRPLGSLSPASISRIRHPQLSNLTFPGGTGSSIDLLDLYSNVTRIESDDQPESAFKAYQALETLTGIMSTSPILVGNAAIDSLTNRELEASQPARNLTHVRTDVVSPSLDKDVMETTAAERKGSKSLILDIASTPSATSLTYFGEASVQNVEIAAETMTSYATVGQRERPYRTARPSSPFTVRPRSPISRRTRPLFVPNSLYPDDRSLFNICHSAKRGALRNLLTGRKLHIRNSQTSPTRIKDVPEAMLIYFCGEQHVERLLHKCSSAEEDDLLIIPESKVETSAIARIVRYMRRCCMHAGMRPTCPMRAPPTLKDSIEMMRACRIFGLYADAERFERIMVKQTIPNGPLSMEDVELLWEGYGGRLRSSPLIDGLLCYILFELIGKKNEATKDINFLLMQEEYVGLKGLVGREIGRGKYKGEMKHVFLKRKEVERREEWDFRQRRMRVRERTNLRSGFIDADANESDNSLEPSEKLPSDSALDVLVPSAAEVYYENLRPSRTASPDFPGRASADDIQRTNIKIEGKMRGMLPRAKAQPNRLFLTRSVSGASSSVDTRNERDSDSTPSSRNVNYAEGADMVTYPEFLANRKSGDTKPRPSCRPVRPRSVSGYFSETGEKGSPQRPLSDNSLSKSDTVAPPHDDIRNKSGKSPVSSRNPIRTQPNELEVELEEPITVLDFLVGIRRNTVPPNRLQRSPQSIDKPLPALPFQKLLPSIPIAESHERARDTSRLTFEALRENEHTELTTRQLLEEDQQCESLQSVTERISKAHQPLKDVSDGLFNSKSAAPKFEVINPTIPASHLHVTQNQRPTIDRRNSSLTPRSHPCPTCGRCSPRLRSARGLTSGMGTRDTKYSVLVSGNHGSRGNSKTKESLSLKDSWQKVQGRL